MANTNLKEAKAAKNDEFYTQFHDIEIEMNAYLEYDPNVFRGKTVLLPCDDPEWSNFTRFFAAKFDELGIKKLISTSYAPDAKKMKLLAEPSLFEMEAPQFDPKKAQTKGKIFILDKDITNDGRVNIEDLQWEYLEGDGDFRVNKDSYVWDFATGSAGLLVAAMNEMLIDARKNILSPEELKNKETKIKAEQLLGIELLSSIYMLAILNMILMGDGSSNILNKDSLKDFDGKYGFGRSGDDFPADAFILNPPYSAKGCGMIFVEKALSMMNKGYAAIIIQNSAGSGKASEYNRNILKRNTLLASIKMPLDLFIGKSSVQTYVYVFRVNEAHKKDDVVKFIDFSNDGYTRTNRKKASNNLKDTDHAKERYEEVVNLVRFGRSKLNIFTDKEYYEGTIDPNNGGDWNQSAPIDTKPTLQDFKKTISDYLAWEVSNLLRNKNNEEDCLGK